MTRIIFPAYDKIQELFTRTVAANRGLNIILTMKDFRNEYNNWPSSFDEIRDKIPAETLIDPFSDSELKYVVRGDKFLLYSVGPNKIDEKGMPKPSCRDGSCRKDDTKTDDVLIWPQSRKDAQAFYDSNDVGK